MSDDIYIGSVFIGIGYHDIAFTRDITVWQRWGLESTGVAVLMTCDLT